MEIFISLISEVWYESSSSKRDEYRFLLQQQMAFEAL